MDGERDQLVEDILAIDKRIYRYLRLGGIPEWAEVELTMPQLKVLFLAGGPRPMPTSQVARALGMTLSTATGVVDRLVARGHVRRLEDPADRRIVLLEATPEGRELLEAFLRESLALFRQILDSLSLKDLRTIAAAFQILDGAAVSLENQSQ